MGNLGIVDLTQQTVTISRTPEPASLRFLGGRGLAAHLLFEFVPPDTAGQGADNAVILSSGPLNGTPWPAASRYHLTFRSPLTGCYGYANAGGKMGPYLAHAGFDAVIIRGRAKVPSYVLVEADRLSVRPAAGLWTRTTSDTESALHRTHPNAAVACIGPAGEQQVLFASVMNDGGRAAARTGGGAVFGAKNLKAVVVAPCAPRSVPSAFLAESRRAANKLLTAPGLADLRRYGTPYLTAIKNVVGDLPTRNHQLGQISTIDKVDAQAFELYKQETKGCLGCPIRCGRVSAVDAGPYRCRTAGPEYETIDSLGPQCGCDDPEPIIYANMLCNELGLDTLSTGAAIAFAMECHERGLLDDDGLDLAWGTSDTVVALVRCIAMREGLGNLLADGVRRAASKIGEAAVPLAMEVKGLEIPSQDGRVAKAFGLGHATSNRGADHLYGLPTIDAACLEDVGRRMLPHAMPRVMDPADELYKPDLLVLSENYCAVADSLGVCKFSTVETWALWPDDLARGLRALGVDVDGDELLRCGERIVNLERTYNVGLGLSASDDRLPARFTQEPLRVRHGDRVTEHRFDDFPAMLARYYALRGWSEQGNPTDEKLHDMDLGRMGAKEAA
jgi:aldehyde:ferredoxin oxidoreductase